MISTPLQRPCLITRFRCAQTRNQYQKTYLKQLMEATPNYIQEHFALWEEVNELELWYVWLGSESTPYIETSCPLDKVTPEVLGEFFADPYLDFKLTIVR